jgi:hypothetical protein
MLASTVQFSSYGRQLVRNRRLPIGQLPSQPRRAAHLCGTYAALDGAPGDERFDRGPARDRAGPPGGSPRPRPTALSAGSDPINRFRLTGSPPAARSPFPQDPTACPAPQVPVDVPSGTGRPRDDRGRRTDRSDTCDCLVDVPPMSNHPETFARDVALHAAPRDSV